MKISPSAAMRRKADRAQAMADILKQKGSPRAQTLAASLLAGAKLRLQIARRLESDPHWMTDQTAESRPSRRS